MNKRGFTLAEILVSLTIIGIIAAIVLPSLMADIQEKAFTAQKAAFYSRMSQALAQFERLNGFGSYSEQTTSGTTTVTDTAGESFISEGLSKFYKIANICSPGKLDKCGIPSQYYPMTSDTLTNFPKTWSELNGTVYPSSDTPGKIKAAAFETKNGESVAVFYNPYCSVDIPNITLPQMSCVNMVYDLNGVKGPNRAGKDIGFLTAFYAKDPHVVAPISQKADAGSAPSYSETGDDAATLCNKQDPESRLPDIDELTAMLINYRFSNFGLIWYDAGNTYWSGTVLSAGASGKAYAQGASSSTATHSSNFKTNRTIQVRSTSYKVRCIKK